MSPFRRALLAAALLAAAASPSRAASIDGGPDRRAAAAAVAAPVPDAGGDDVVVLTHESLSLANGYSVAIASNGDLYVAVEVSAAPADPEIRVLRSQDGGTSWAEWGVLSSDAADVTYGNPSLHIGEGDQDRLYVAYRHTSGVGPATIDVAYSPLAVPQAQWTTRTVLAQAGVAFRRPDLTSDAVNVQGYRLYLVAEGDDGNGADIWFSRSADFGNAWSAEYRFATSLVGTTTFASAVVAYGFGGVIHVAYEIWRTANDDRGIGYRRAINSAANGLVDWQPGLTLASTADGAFDGFATLAASPTTGAALVAWDRFVPDPLAVGSAGRGSADGGATWDAAVLDEVPFIGHGDLLTLPGGLGFRVGAITFGGFGIAEAAEATPTAWGPVRMMSDHWTGTAGDAPKPAADPTRQNRIAIVWGIRYNDGPDTLFFDAEWRRDPGYPSLQPGFPAALPDAPGSSPALANLDQDSELEIVFGDQAGRVRVYDADGSLEAGWPVDLGDLPGAGPIAAGDVDGDGRNEVVAGTADGLVYRLSGAGVAFPSWPVDLGTAQATYVSLGAIGAGSHRQIVACSGTEVHVLDAQGSSLAGFPRVVGEPIEAPAAIGDVDGDGAQDLVVVGGHTITMLRGSGLLLTALFIPTATFTEQASLADLDLDGDLEIVLPTLEGTVQILHHTGDAYSGWPLVEPTASPITTVAIANLAAGVRPELAFAARDGMVHLLFETGSELAGWPHAVAPGGLVSGGPIIEDLDGGSSDVAVGSGDGIGHAWKNLLNPVPGWPRDLLEGCAVSPASGDLDHDGIVDLVFATATELVAFSTGAPLDRADPRNVWPMQGYNAERQACLACGPDAVTGVPSPTRASVRLAPPRPNPARGPVTLEFELPDAAAVRLAILDLAGREVRRLARREAAAGPHRIEWDLRDDRGTPVAAGIYYARLGVDGPATRIVDTREFALLR